TACHHEIDKTSAPAKINTEKIRTVKEIVHELKQDDVILDVQNLKVSFPIVKGILHRKVGELRAVDNISFQVRKGETFGLVGESGCGKSTLARTLLRLNDPSGGNIIFNG